MEKDLVSIIIATHNRAEYLKKAIISALNQAYKCIEIIVIANGCKDNTVSIISELTACALSKQQNTPIIFLEFPDTLGGAKARNIGIDQARGEYIAFMDDDDFWHKDKLQCQIALLEDNKYSLISTNFIYYYGEDSLDKKHSPSNKALIRLQDLYYDNALMGFSLCMTKRAYIGKSRINENLAALQDWDLWFKILINTNLPAYINQQCHVYLRLGHNRISTNLSKVLQAQQRFLAIWQPILDKPSIDFHKMRILCLEIKIQTHGKYRNYFLQMSHIIRTIFNSPYRYQIKKYIHYLLLPIASINDIRIWLWSKTRFGYNSTRNDKGNNQVMSLQCLIATVEDHFFERKYQPPFADYLIINQISAENNPKHRAENIFTYREKGLSKSRNKALQKATADICLIADDDIVFLDHVDTIILDAFEKHPSADIITFQAQNPTGTLLKNYTPKHKQHNLLSIMNVSSWEIVFNRRSVITAGLCFDEHFGLGSQFATGEESIFLLDALRKGLNLLYVPTPIVVHAKDSSGDHLDNPKLVRAKGAMFCRMFGFRAYIIALLFALKKHSLSKFGWLRFYRLMLVGIREYKKIQ